VKIRIDIAEEAERQFQHLDAWWRQNRQAAADQVADEFERIRKLLAEQPEIGTPFLRGGNRNIRWIPLRKTPYKPELITTAGRFLLVLWSVNGNGTRTTSPNSKTVIDGIVLVVPNLFEGFFRELGRRANELAITLACAQKVDEVLDLGDLLRR
jgi:plasmid stabilization system protein ParE